MTDIALPRGQSAVTRWLGFAALCAGMFMAVLDIQIVVTSLSVIEEALGIGADRMSWVQTAYLIAEVIAIPITGLLTRVFSLRWLVAGAITIFTLASIGCALSTGFGMLIAFRVIQGFAGGVLIPVVFSAIFLLFRPGPEQTIATTLGGMLAVLAPAVGPITGGLLTENYSWHWLFLINVVPGILTIAVAVICLPREAMQFGLLRRLDFVSLLFIALALAGLEVGLKEAPDLGWLSPIVLGLFAAFAFLMLFAILRPKPAVDFTLLRDRHLAFGCGISFILGIGLFGAVYLLPVFLAFVRHMGPIDIGIVVLVTGIAQLVSAPFAVLLDQKVGARLLTTVGFALFTAGVIMSGFATRESDFNDLFWPQVLRGCAVALCILPVTRFALGLLPLGQVSDASGLYNLSRNLGGAIGIALIDTVLFTRAADHAGNLTDLIKASPQEAAAALGVGIDELPDPDDPLGFMGIMDTLQEVSLTLAINEAWLMLGALSAIALVLVWAMGPIRVPDGHVTLRSRARF